MLRTVALRMGKGLAVAGAASAAQPRSAGADARTARPPSLPRASKTTEGSQEEAWLEVTLNEEGVIFSPQEVEETVEEIVGLCDNTTENEGLDAGSSSEMRLSHARPEEAQFMKDVFRASQRMASHPAVQSATVTAMRDDEELRKMIEDLGNCHLTPVEDPVEHALPMIEFEAPATHEGHNNPLLTMFQDIAHQLGRLSRAVRRTGGRMGSLLRNAISWMLKSVDEALDMVGQAADEAVERVFPSAAKLLHEVGPAGKAGSLVAACAMLIIVVMIIRRRII